jgi:hypothetical protein
VNVWVIKERLHIFTWLAAAGDQFCRELSSDQNRSARKIFAISFLIPLGNLRVVCGPRTVAAADTARATPPRLPRRSGDADIPLAHRQEPSISSGSFSTRATPLQKQQPAADSRLPPLPPRLPPSPIPPRALVRNPPPPAANQTRCWRAPRGFAEPNVLSALANLDARGRSTGRHQLFS